MYSQPTSRSDTLHIDLDKWYVFILDTRAK